MIKRIPLGRLKPGMFVSSFDLSWFKHPFVSTRLGVVRDQRLIEELRRLGVTTVEIDTEKCEDLPPPNNGGGAVEVKKDKAFPDPKISGPSCPPPDDAERTAKFARKLFDQAMDITRSLMDGVAKGANVNVDELRPFLSKLIDTVERNENVLHIITSLKSYDDYTYTHSLNLAAFGVLLGNSAGLVAEELEHLAMAGMLHDVGKCLLPKEIVTKPGPLSPGEFEEIKRHPSLGHEHLSRQNDIPAVVLRAVFEHHERVDGSGYPRGVSGPEIHPYSSIISVVDVYDALTSDRVYRSRMSPHMALRTLFNLRGQAFPEGYVDLFIKRLGVYPAFSVVQLRNGCYALVTRQTPGKPLFPEVMVFCDQERRPIVRRRVDTWRMCGELARKEFEIERHVEPGELAAPAMAGIA